VAGYNAELFFTISS